MKNEALMYFKSRLADNFMKNISVFRLWGSLLTEPLSGYIKRFFVFKPDLLIIILLLIISCNNSNKSHQTDYPVKETEILKIAKMSKSIYTCDELQNNKKLYSIADSILQLETHPNIINLHVIDSTDITVFEDYFIYPDKKSKMMFFSGEAGFSSGNSTYLLILFHCKNAKAEIIWSGQSAMFVKNNIKDLNGDGVKEIIISSGAAWMSSEVELFEIINFKNGKRNTLYSTLSNTQQDYFEEDWYCLDDTISCTYKNMIMDSGKAEMIKIKQTKTVQLFNGGKTKEEAFKNSKIKANSTIIIIQ